MFFQVMCHIGNMHAQAHHAKFGAAKLEEADRHPDGRYDASNGGDIEGLHWVYKNVPISLFTAGVPAS